MASLLRILITKHFAFKLSNWISNARRQVPILVAALSPKRRGLYERIERN